ncbi:MAG: tetratricopeptide repeat protein [Azospirillaceae bacterium]|nr:tetratricopeptide repeat protein [Azospirillaceae bacterium]
MIVAVVMTAELFARLAGAAAHQQAGEWAEAIRGYRGALAIRDDLPQIHHVLGVLFLKLGASATAIAALRQALILEPGYALAHATLATALRSAGQAEAALTGYRRALQIDLPFPEMLGGLGAALCDLGAGSGAQRACQQAIRLKPDDADAYNNMGSALVIAGRIDDARAAYGRAVSLCPDSPLFHVNHGLALLHLGRWVAGWDAFDWRWRIDKFRSLSAALSGPQWDGAPLQGRTILLYGEQGLGDVLQFARFAPLVAAQGGRVVLRVMAPLVTLLRRLPDVAAVVAFEDPLPPYDCHLPLMSVPRLLQPDPAAVPARIPYLFPDPVQVAAWSRRLAELAGAPGRGIRTVGLVWAGDPRHRDIDAHPVDRRRSIDLAPLACLADVPGLTLVSLQKGAAAAAARPPGLTLVDWMDEVTDFADTAALVAALDLVITVDTAVAHLAGALGRPVWILSRYDGCWRWLRDRDDTPWYPTARLFRQRSPGDWDEVLERVVAALRHAITADPGI